MYLPVWAIILLALGWVGFLWLLIRRDGGRDLDHPPRMLTASAAPQFNLPPRPGDGIPPELVAELRQMVAAGQKIQAIKRLREVTHWGLSETKEWVERL